MSAPIRIHPSNPKLFEFRGKPVVLVTACEHYGSVMNRPFDFETYLADTAAVGINYTRLFTLFRELQSGANPYSTCKPESTDYVAPFPRVGPGRAADLLPRYDLDRWSDEFQERLHRFLAGASAYGIIVELVLFSNTYGNEGWSLNPLNAGNNVNDVESIPWYDYNTRRHPRLLAYQEAYARRMVREINRYDNVVIEVCNEPGGGVGVPGAPTPDDVNDWLDHMISLVRETEAELPNRHLVVGQDAFAYKLPEETVNLVDVHQFCARSFGPMDYDAVNMHPLSNMKHAGRTYDLGRFMHAQLHLRAYRDYCLATYVEPKPLNLDEDNCATMYRDPMGWTIHRKRAWTAVFCGAHYDAIDFSIRSYLPTGTPESRRWLRVSLGNLVRFVETLDLVHSRPLTELVASHPNAVCVSAFGDPATDVAIYLADAREVDEPACGDPIEGELQLAVPAGTYGVSCYDPLNGTASPEVTLEATDGSLSVGLPRFTHDIVVRVRQH